MGSSGTARTLCRAMTLACALVCGRGVSSTAQTPPKVFHACYVPLTGTIYRVNEPDLKPACTSPSHVAFSWTDGAGAGATLPTNAAGAFDLSNINGIVASGDFFNGVIPASGLGQRFMWYARKAALRAGQVGGTQWDDANVGFASAAFGTDVTASGQNAFAVGLSAHATGPSSIAIGSFPLASGTGAIALGASANSTGFGSVAIGLNAAASGSTGFSIGSNTTASGDQSMALGSRASTNGMAGSLVYGDASSAAVFRNMTSNEFAVRAAGGVRFRTSSSLATGCNLAAGSGTWDCTSSRFAKTNFRALSGDNVLRKIERMPIESWQYRTDTTGARHVGPTAQDFHAAFGLGTSDASISLVDIDGINLAGIKALVQRTNALAHENAELRRRIEKIEKMLDSSRGKLP